MSARRHFLPIVLAESRPVLPQQLASSPDLVRNRPARILVVASRAVPRRNLLALPLQFVRPLLPNRTVAGPSAPMRIAMPLSAARRHKIRPASVVHPNPVIVGAPRVSLLASRPAPLLHQLHTAPRIHLAVISPAIVRSAVKRLRRAIGTSRMFRPLVRLRHKLRTASMVYPDPSLVEAPRYPFVARRLAVLADQVHVPARVRFAVMPTSIIRRAAHNRFVSPAFSRPLELHPEVRPASVVDPDSTLVVAPGISLLTSGATRLLFHCHASPSIRRTIPPVPIIRRAGNLPSPTRLLAPHNSRKRTHHRYQHNQHSQNSHVSLRLR